MITTTRRITHDMSAEAHTPRPGLTSEKMEQLAALHAKNEGGGAVGAGVGIVARGFGLFGR